MFCKFSASGFGWIAFSFAFLPCQAMGKTTNSCAVKRNVQRAWWNTFHSLRRFQMFQKVILIGRHCHWFPAWLLLILLIPASYSVREHEMRRHFSHIMVAFYDPCRIWPLHSMIPRPSLFTHAWWCFDRRLLQVPWMQRSLSLFSNSSEFVSKILCVSHISQ